MRPAPARTLLELVTFAALAWYAAAHWASGLVADASGARVFACVVIGVAVAVAITLAEAAPSRVRWLLQGGSVVAGLGAGFVAIGLERRLLAPAHWDELGDGLDRGFAALGSVHWPYDGSEPWGSVVLLLAIPLVVTAAAAFAFFGRRRRLRPVAVVLLLGLYGVAVTEHEVSGELGRGVALLLLTAAWLWLPRMPERGAQTAIAAAGAVLVACLAALPAAARYKDDEPLVDYKSWNPFGSRAATRFNWSHKYGPIDWPREGTTLMNVRSEERHYWRLETLDTFDGTRWVRAGQGRGNNPLLPSPYNLVWETDFRVTIRDLDTDLIPIAGTALQITGADPVVVPSSDGTVEALGESLDEGDTYFVEAYVPEPTPEEMRVAFPEVPNALISDTQILLPGPQLATPERILASPYARVLRLARRLARGQPTTYDIVRAVQSHLRTEYTYGERPPTRRFPLAAFLFRDQIGYCQHFSGAMALMLRMLGIPARVAAGFTPGSYNADTKEYRVRDLDAHSWVEVWFTNVGWVPFDPTPSAAPAESQSGVDAASASGGPTTVGEIPDPAGTSSPIGSDGGGDDSASGDSSGTAIQPWMAFAAIVLLGAAAVAAPRVRALARRRPRGDVEDSELAALRRALARTGALAEPGLTLRRLELQLESTSGPPAARYVRMLRERRYAPEGGQLPDTAARRELRRALARGRGLRARLAAMTALPPVLFRRG